MWFYRRAEQRVGWPSRVVQWVYYRVGSLDQFQKSGRKFRSAREVLASGGEPVLAGLMERLALPRTHKWR